MEWSFERVPRTMSTQHPDNARPPSWCSGEVIQGEDEVREAFYAYSALGCREVMWDSEGKDVDTRVVRKLLAAHGDFFREHVLGEDLFLTYRLPNPRIEEAERKVVAETLLNIAVGFDVASTFYGREVAPIFEVILPFTTSHEEVVALHRYYEALTRHAELGGEVAKWLGEFKPERVNVIPLIEDLPSLLSADHIVKLYAEAMGLRRVRVFIARSDPALNYGLPSAVALAKLALYKLSRLRDEGVEAYPIIGVGCLPFRGHLSPNNLANFLDEYGGVVTVTVQSALKYDYEEEVSRRAVAELNHRLPAREAMEVEDEEALLRALDKLREAYQGVVEDLAPLINSLSMYVPPRRARRLHIGLFGYSRGVRGVRLPRAIPFTCALYSLGLPPEFLGLRALRELEEDEWRALTSAYLNLDLDLSEAGRFVSWRNLEEVEEEAEGVARRAGMLEDRLREALFKVEEDLKAAEEMLGVKLGPRSPSERRHENTVNSLLLSYLEGDEQYVRHFLVEAAYIRRSLG